MAYVPPVGSSVAFVFNDAYTPPAGNSVSFVFSDGTAPTPYTEIVNESLLSADAIGTVSQATLSEIVSAADQLSAVFTHVIQELCYTTDVVAVSVGSTAYEYAAESILYIDTQQPYARVPRVVSDILSDLQNIITSAALSNTTADVLSAADLQIAFLLLSKICNDVVSGQDSVVHVLTAPHSVVELATLQGVVAAAQSYYMLPLQDGIVIIDLSDRVVNRPAFASDSVVAVESVLQELDGIVFIDLTDTVLVQDPTRSSLVTQYILLDFATAADSLLLPVGVYISIQSGLTQADTASNTAVKYATVAGGIIVISDGGIPRSIVNSTAHDLYLRIIDAGGHNAVIARSMGDAVFAADAFSNWAAKAVIAVDPVVTSDEALQVTYKVGSSQDGLTITELLTPSAVSLLLVEDVLAAVTEINTSAVTAWVGIEVASFADTSLLIDSLSPYDIIAYGLDLRTGLDFGLNVASTLEKELGITTDLEELLDVRSNKTNGIEL